MKKSLNRSSDSLLAIVDKKAEGDISYQAILDKLGDRAFGIVLLFFALPSALPFSSIPGVSFVFSVPIALFACQMIMGRTLLWLPKFIAKQTIPQKAIKKMTHKAVPYLRKIEYFVKPRWTFMTNRFMEIMNGFIILCLAILLMLPIPLSNFIFAGLLILFSLGLIEKDGIFIVLGYVGFLFYLSFIYLFIVSIISPWFS